MSKIKVLFVCNHNSARSQMAEAFLNSLAPNHFQAESAGLEAGKLNSFAVAVMKEAGVDISANKTKEVFDLYKEGRLYSYVVTVCDQASAEKCPVFPGIRKMIHWSFPDPSAVKGTEEEKLVFTRKVRDAIKMKVLSFIWANT
jgi:arsenate reductase